MPSDAGNTTLGLLMATINSSIVLIALPDIFRGIGIDPPAPGNTGYLLWMITGSPRCWWSAWLAAAFGFTVIACLIAAVASWSAGGGRHPTRRPEPRGVALAAVAGQSGGAPNALVSDPAGPSRIE